MNLVILVGNLTRDPEVRYSTNGTPIATLDLAINRSFTKEGGPDADFLRVTVFGKQAEHAGNYLTKGKKVGVEGRIENNNYENKDGQKVYRDSIIANRIEFLSPKSEGGQSPFGGMSESRGPWQNENAATEAPNTSSPAPQGNGMPLGLSQLDDDDDDLPF